MGGALMQGKHVRRTPTRQRMGVADFLDITADAGGEELNVC